MGRLKLVPRPLLFTMLALLWMTALFLFSSIPGNHVPLPNIDDKLKHIVAYALLGFLLAAAVASHVGRLAWYHVAAVTLLAFSYGMLDEYHQSFVPLRNVSFGDVIADTFGGFIAALWARRWVIIRKPGTT